MSYYYKYNFVSPEPVYATIKEELKSYFDTGAVDDLLFPTYLDKCLKKLGRTTYVISEEVLTIENFEARLPDNFYAVREAWLCTDLPGRPYQTANSFYSQAVDQTTIQVSPVTVGGQLCNHCNQSGCAGDCMPELIQAVYKTNNETPRYYHKQYLLKPGNISVRANCTLDCINLGSSAPDTFDNYPQYKELHLINVVLRKSKDMQILIPLQNLQHFQVHMVLRYQMIFRKHGYD